MSGGCCELVVTGSKYYQRESVIEFSSLPEARRGAVAAAPRARVTRSVRLCGVRLLPQIMNSLLSIFVSSQFRGAADSIPRLRSVMSVHCQSIHPSISQSPPPPPHHRAARRGAALRSLKSPPSLRRPTSDAPSSQSGPPRPSCRRQKKHRALEPQRRSPRRSTTKLRRRGGGHARLHE